MSPPRLSAKTAATLDFIKAEVAAGRPFPSAEQIRLACGYGDPSRVEEVLVYLAFHGHIVRVSRKPSGRGFRVTYGLPAGDPVPFRTKTYTIDPAKFYAAPNPGQFKPGQSKEGRGGR